MIVIIEGPNRVGKSTQIANLKNFYECKGMRVHVIHYEHIHKPHLRLDDQEP